MVTDHITINTIGVGGLVLALGACSWFTPKENQIVKDPRALDGSEQQITRFHNGYQVDEEGWMHVTFIRQDDDCWLRFRSPHKILNHKSYKDEGCNGAVNVKIASPYVYHKRNSDDGFQSEDRNYNNWLKRLNVLE